MKIKDLQTGTEHEYGTNPHDSLMVSDDGRTLTYYNLQNGDGSRYGDYRFKLEGDEDDPYWNIGGFEMQIARWIPCSEMLPSEFDHKDSMVLVCYENGSIRFNTYMNGWVHGNPIAWMPMPKAYRGGNNE